MTTCEDQPYDNEDFEHFKTGVVIHPLDVKFQNAAFPMRLKKGTIVTICGVCQYYADPMTPCLLIYADDQSVPYPVPRDSILITNDRN